VERDHAERVATEPHRQAFGVAHGIVPAGLEVPGIHILGVGVHDPIAPHPLTQVEIGLFVRSRSALEGERTSAARSGARRIPSCTKRLAC